MSQNDAVSVSLTGALKRQPKYKDNLKLLALYTEPREQHSLQNLTFVNQGGRLHPFLVQSVWQRISQPPVVLHPLPQPTSGVALTM